MITTEQNIHDLGPQGYKQWVLDNSQNLTIEGAWGEAAKRAYAQIEYVETHHPGYKELAEENQRLRKLLRQFCQYADNASFYIGWLFKATKEEALEALNDQGNQGERPNPSTLR